MSAVLDDPTARSGPLAPLRTRWRTWWDARHPRSDTLQLTQRNVYILPTRAGWVFALTLGVLLVASINYQLSLGYLLTFLLAGSGLVSMHVTHATLRGLSLHLRPPQPVFAGEAAVVECVLASTATRTRHGIGLRLAGPERPPHWSWTDVPAGGQSAMQLSFVAPRRGRLPLPHVVLETRFPLGLFRAWSEWRPQATVLAYPQPERPTPPLPPARAAGGEASTARSSEGGELEGIRAYRRGDPLKLVVWKKAARALDTGGELVSRDTRSAARQELWLDWAATGGLSPEARLSRLAAWVLAVEQSGAAWGLRLPGREWPPATGEAHRRAALEALTLWA
ncbi:MULTISPECIES: DUF58 domain-containing protein [unclassified Methylibium]|uniref:DUF58 domain-containing protein n=1 Tax=unclassified Methylibium TaxID=2633235 RepID=UPI0003F3FFBF|nr:MULTISPECIES: DUF58 domain-containing protein [unclassified Methylibium]EWS56462.1 hypothetical protein X551_00701 [Methylibium sp. T29]EWS61580.1 hypothetical protein Y694_00639 [Methylibium sp. T29-B]